MDKADLRTSALLTAGGFRHAFFTRWGGVSDGAYATLNFSYAVGDSADNVRHNLQRAGRALGVEPDRIYYVSQVHGRNIVLVDGTRSREDLLAEEGDAVVSATSGTACGVRTADCVPILVARRGTGAVAAIHAGWRGMVAGVIGATLQNLGGNPFDCIAAIGPHISVAAFEVSEDVAAALTACSPDPDVVRHDYGSKPHVDLRRIARAQLTAAGVPPDGIDDVRGCTVTDADFFSYRRDGPRSGRHLSAIVAKRVG